MLRLAQIRLIARWLLLAATAARPSQAQLPQPHATPGLGALSFPTSTRSAPAQAAFERGVLLLHLFEYPSAVAAFRTAEQLDPSFAMAYWGEAMTFTHPVWNQQDVAGGRAVLARLAPTPAARSARAATAREQGYLNAVEILYGDGAKAHRDTLYAQAMGRLAEATPGDDEAVLFHALALLGLSQGVRNVATYTRAAAMAESVFARNGRHPGAAHYWIHGLDDPEHSSRALVPARALSTIAPDAGHAQHMTSHIFLALGMWDDLVVANETALRVVTNARHAEGRHIGNCGHYFSWLHYGYLQQGRVVDARRLLDACRSDATGASLPDEGGLDPDDAPLFSFLSMWARHVLDTEDWSGVGGWELAPGKAPAARLTYYLTRGFAAAGRQDQAGVHAARAAFDAARQDMDSRVARSRDATPETREFQKRTTVLGLELKALEALGIGERGGRPGRGDSAVVFAGQARETEDGMAYAFGPPFVDKPARELEGDVLRSLGRAREARDAYERALARTPRRTTALLGLARVAAAAGDRAAASKAYAALDSIWTRADTTLAPVLETRRFRRTVGTDPR